MLGRVTTLTHWGLSELVNTSEPAEEAAAIA